MRALIARQWGNPEIGSGPREFMVWSLSKPMHKPRSQVLHHPGE
jgi:hypothetical protein